MATGPRLCLLPNAGSPRRTIRRVAHGVSAAPDHLRALRASACICAESFLAPRCHRSHDAGRGHQRSWSGAASSVAALISEGNDSMAGSRKSSPCRCLAGDSRQTARIFGVQSFTGCHGVPPSRSLLTLRAGVSLMCQSAVREALFSFSVKLPVNSVKLCVRLTSLPPFRPWRNSLSTPFVAPEPSTCHRLDITPADGAT